MPVPMSELEQHSAKKVSKELQAEISEDKKQKSLPPKKSNSRLIDRFSRFIDDLATPRGT